MKTVPLNKGYFAKVDDSDFEKVSGYTWFISDQGYAKSTLWDNGKAKQIKMHHLLFGKPKKGELIDHKNGDKLDNRHINLRTCTNAQNMRNRAAPKSNLSGYKGVAWLATRNKWRARIKVFYKEIHLGLFKTKEKAALEYNRAAKKYFGEFAYINNIV